VRDLDIKYVAISINFFWGYFSSNINRRFFGFSSHFNCCF